ncbi:TPA: ParA family protein [Candidatus Poribacteria bacterium]|nr:ParA family protein [Candidatus Poribacteria bacterium]
MSKVIAVANQKGGVGKTTTAINLSACLADLGFKILLLDTDPQSNTTSGLGLDPRKLNKSIYHVLIDNVPITEIITDTSVKRLSLVPSNADLVGAEVEMVSLIAREMRLRSALQSVRDQYDYIIIDCPPSLGLITLNALTACDSVIIPIQCEYYALEGLGQLLETITLVKDNLNPKLEIEGILLTMQDRRVKLSDQVISEVRNYFKGRVYNTNIPRNIRLSEAPSFGKPIILYDPKSAGAKAYMKLAKEVSGHE